MPKPQKPNQYKKNKKKNILENLFILHCVLIKPIAPKKVKSFLEGLLHAWDFQLIVYLSVLSFLFHVYGQELLHCLILYIKNFKKMSDF